jgi:hypothetical protein
MSKITNRPKSFTSSSKDTIIHLTYTIHGDGANFHHLIDSNGSPVVQLTGKKKEQEIEQYAN